MNTSLHKLVVVGGGAGGLELVTRLGRTVGKHRLARPILIDSAPTHIWKPLLHEVATGALNTGEDELNYFAHGHHNFFEFEFGKMIGLNRKERTVHLDQISSPEGQLVCQPRDVPYDTLVLALGAIPNHFNTPGVEKHCYFLNTPAEAEKLRIKLLLQALAVVTGNTKVPKLRIGIVGGGATGVELAAEIFHTICELRQLGSKMLQTQLEITIMEGSPAVLSSGPVALSKYATEELAKRNITIKANCWIKAVEEDAFVFKDGSKLESDIKIWTAGIKAPDFLSTLGLSTNKINQIKTNRQLQSLDDENIYALGDCSCVPAGGGAGAGDEAMAKSDDKFLTATAQVAHQEAEWLAARLAKLFDKKHSIGFGSGQQQKPFVFKPQGMLVSMGEGEAAANLAALIGPKRDYYFEGRAAKLLYASLYRMHQAVLYGWPRAIFLWIGDKLRKVALPQLKLH